MNWDLPKQTFLVENGQVGDCWRCCIAAILQVPAESVPHFLKEALAQERNEDCMTQEWLNERGYCLIQVEDAIIFHTFQTPFKGIPVIEAGPTERSRGMGKHHCIVTYERKMVYDPHPSNAGLTYVAHRYLIVPLYERFHPIVNCNCGGLCPACAVKTKEVNFDA